MRSQITILMGFNWDFFLQKDVNVFISDTQGVEDELPI